MEEQRSRRNKKCGHPDCSNNPPVFISDQLFWDHMNKAHDYQIGEWCDHCSKFVQNKKIHDQGERHKKNAKAPLKESSTSYDPGESSNIMVEDQPVNDTEIQDDEEFDSFESFTNTTLLLDVHKSPDEWYESLTSEIVETSTREIHNVEQIESTPEDFETESLKLSGWGHRWGIGKGALEDLLQMLNSEDFDHKKHSRYSI